MTVLPWHEPMVYRKASSRGAYMDMILFEVFLKNIYLIPQDQIVQ